RPSGPRRPHEHVVVSRQATVGEPHRPSGQSRKPDTIQICPHFEDGQSLLGPSDDRKIRPPQRGTPHFVIKALICPKKSMVWSKFFNLAFDFPVSNGKKNSTCHRRGCPPPKGPMI